MDYCMHDNNSKTCFYCKINQRKEEKEKFLEKMKTMKFYLSLDIFSQVYDTSYKFNADSSISASLLKSKKIKI